MEYSNLADSMAYLAGAIGMLSLAPQIIKTIKTKSARDLSLVMLIMTLVSYLLYAIYGLMLGLVPVVATTLISAFLCSILLYFYFKYS